MIYPQFPSEGEYIGITAPSAGVGHKAEAFDMSLDAIRSLGYNIYETDSVRNDDARSAAPWIRADELKQLFDDDDIKMIISAAGGDYALEMLPYVDWESIVNNPKWIAGSSDPTNLLFPITTNFDIATIYGFNAGTFDWEELHEFQINALRIMSGDIVNQRSFDMYDASRDFNNPYAPDEKVYWDLMLPGKAPNSRWSRLDITGRLIGGCMDCIGKLIGTPFDGTPGFVERHKDEGIIWYFDPFAMDADGMYLQLLQMKYAGYFEGTKAVVFGRVMFPMESETYDYLERISRVLDVPVIFNADIGHVKPSMTLINGAWANIKCRNGKGLIKMALV